MQHKLVAAGHDGRTFALVFDKGENAVEGLQQFAREQELGGSHFTGVGALQRVVLGWFDPDKMEYRRNPIEDQVEVVSLVGNVAVGPDGPKVHAHVVVAASDARAYGGHFLEGTVWPTLEVVLTESPLHLRRRIDSATGLALLEL